MGLGAGTFDIVMHSAAASFTARDHGPASAVAGLSEVGFVFGPSHTVTRTLLDTFDGRLHGAGLRLELRQRDGFELILSGEGTVPAHLTVRSAPRFPDDLPPGPFRARLTGIVEVRALLPVVHVTATCTPAMWHDRSDKTVATATVYEHLRVDDHDVIDLAQWTIEIDELTGYAKPARRARDMLERLGLSRLGGDTLTEAAAAAGVDLAGFSGSPAVPLDPEMPAIDGFRAVLSNLADTIVANWHGTIDELDPEFLHDLRVAVRRTRSVLAQGKNVLPLAIGDRSLERFAWLGALTGPARDLDVYLIEWDSYTGPLGADVIAALEPVRALLEVRRQAAHAALVQALQSAEAAELMITWLTWLHEPISVDPQGIQEGRPLATVVTKRIARAQANLVKRGRLIRPDTPGEQVHDLRKDAKKLRYLIECFGSLLPDAPRKTFVRRLKALQDNLGEHQDAEVHIGELRAISRELHQSGASSDTMLAIGQLTERLDQRRIATRAEFAERFAEYDTKPTQSALDTTLDGIAR
jgi:CHAD domain-containing protein